jgi:transposase InsO family protein
MGGRAPLAPPHPLPVAAGAQALVAGAWGSVPASPALGPAWGAGPTVTGGALTAAGTASALAAVANVLPAGVAGPEDPPPPIPPSLVVDPQHVVDQPPPPPVDHSTYTVVALTAARAEHATRQARLRELALVWEREHEAADAIAAQIVVAEQLLASPVAHDGGTTCSDTMGGVYGVPTAPTIGTGPHTIPTVLWHDPADPLVAQLHLQDGSVQNIRLMVPVVLEPESPSYARWRDLLLLTLRRYTLDDHVLCDPTGMAPTAAWVRLDSTGPLYTLRLPHATSSSSLSPDTAAAFAATTSSTTWHCRLGHPGHDALLQLTRSATIPCTRSLEEHLCHACQLGRHVRLLFSSSSSHATHAFDLVHCDLWTSPITSMSDYKYYLVMLDDFSHYVWTFPLRAKSETFPTLRHFFAWVSTQFGLTIKAVQCYNGREFDNSASRDFFLLHGMQLRMSCPYTSSQNGKAERMIRTTNDTIWTLLLQAHLPPRFWAEALHTSTYLLNRLPSTACPALTPHQALFDTPPRYDHLHVFGCACYPNTATTAPHKLAPRSTLCVFLGYSSDHKGYRCFDLSSRRILISRHVVFDESVFPYSSTSTPPSSDPDLDLFTPFPTDAVVEPPILPLSAGTRSPPVGPTPGLVPCPGPVVSPTAVSPLRGAPSPIAPGPSGGGGTALPAGPSVPTPSARFAQPVWVYQRRLPLPGFAPAPSLLPPPPPSPPVAQSPPGTPTPPQQPPATRVETPVYHPPLLHRDPRHVHPMVMRHAAGTLPPRVLAATTIDSQVSLVPSSVRTALLDPHWRQAMEEEYAALVANQTWDLVPRPPGTDVITGKWIWTHKRRADGTLERYKARWVLRGFTQHLGVDYDETFSSVVKPATVRMVLSLALARSWPVHQLDVKNAFLHGALTETVYCCQPVGFVDSSRPDMVCRLNRSLYGLKQAPRAWHSRLATFLVTLGFVEAKSDTSLFIHHHGAEIAYLLLYVDDIVLTASSQSLIRRLVDTLQWEFL